MPDARAPVPQGQSVRAKHDEPEEADGEPAGDGAAALALLRGEAGGGEGFQEALLAAVSRHDADRADGLLGEGGGVGVRLALLRLARLDRLAEEGAGGAEEGHEGEHHEGHLPPLDEADDDAHERRAKVLDADGELGGERLLDRVGVRDDAGEERAGVLLVEEGDLLPHERLEVLAAACVEKGREERFLSWCRP